MFVCVDWCGVGLCVFCAGLAWLWLFCLVGCMYVRVCVGCVCMRCVCVSIVLHVCDCVCCVGCVCLLVSLVGWLVG